MWDNIQMMLSDPLMQRALVAALLVGACAPIVGTYLVQRRLSLLGDGIGHIALTGVALGWLIGVGMGLRPYDVLTIPGAVVTAVIGSILIEVVRRRGKTSGDLALALMFYGGIAGGVLIIGIAGGTSGNLMAYLFGSIAAVSMADLWTTVVLCAIILAVGLGLRTALFAVSHDEEFAIASGMPVWLLNMAVAIVAALTVTVAMRVVGLLLVSALMIVPVAVAQQLTHSFRRTMAVACVVGVFVCLGGLIITYWYPVSPGATIVVLAIVVYLLSVAVHPLIHHRFGHDDDASDPHPDIPDDVNVSGDAAGASPVVEPGAPAPTRTVEPGASAQTRMVEPAPIGATVETTRSPADRLESPA
ncbi:MAG: metal ABC transporter permease [Cellulomonadaceae bacterium]|nr:metal ABC transporter permease [Cellulomonadaceae bacterium]